MHYDQASRSVVCTNNALWPMRVESFPEKDTKIEPKSNWDGSETAGGTTQKRSRRYSQVYLVITSLIEHTIMHTVALVLSSIAVMVCSMSHRQWRCASTAGAPRSSSAPPSPVGEGQKRAGWPYPAVSGPFLRPPTPRPRARAPARGHRSSLKTRCIMSFLMRK